MLSESPFHPLVGLFCVSWKRNPTFRPGSLKFYNVAPKVGVRLGSEDV